MTKSAPVPTSVKNLTIPVAAVASIVVTALAGYGWFHQQMADMKAEVYNLRATTVVKDEIYAQLSAINVTLAELKLEFRHIRDGLSFPKNPKP